MVYSKYAGTEITLENKDHVILKVTLWSKAARIKMQATALSNKHTYYCTGG